MRDHLLGFPAVAGLGVEHDPREHLPLPKPYGLGLPSNSAVVASMRARWAREDDACGRILLFEKANHQFVRPANGGPVKLVSEADCKTGQAAPKAVESIGSGLTMRVNGEAKVSGIGVLQAGGSRYVDDTSDSVLYAPTSGGSAPAEPKPTADAEGWIEWNGGESMPFERGTVAQLRFRSGHDRPAEQIYGFRWWHNGHGGDIVAYRIVKPAAPAAPKAAAGDWIAHDGGPCPENVKYKKVEVRMRSGEMREQFASDELFKNNGKSAYDVLAYRVIS